MNAAQSEENVLGTVVLEPVVEEKTEHETVEDVCRSISMRFSFFRELPYGNDV